MRFVDRLGVVAALSLGPVVATSFARFAYALILPPMRAELALNYAQAGALNTANALGYLAGALLCARYVSRLGNRALFCGGLAFINFGIDEIANPRLRQSKAEKLTRKMIRLREGRRA